MQMLHADDPKYKLTSSSSRTNHNTEIWGCLHSAYLSNEIIVSNEIIDPVSPVPGFIIADKNTGDQ